VPFAPIQRLVSKLTGLVESKLWLQVLLGLVLGCAIGVVLGPTVGLVEPHLARGITSWLALPGDLFIRLVQMIMIPLVVASIVQGIAGGGERDRLASLGLRVALYFVGTTVVAIVLGLAAALLLRPGRDSPLAALKAAPVAAPSNAPSAVDVPGLISGLLPSNPLASVLAGEMLSIVIFSVIVAAALVSMPRERAEPVLGLLFSVQEICMTVTRWAMRLAPLAVLGLMARTTAASGLAAITSLGLYVLTVLAALAVVAILYLIVVATATSLRWAVSCARRATSCFWRFRWRARRP
jgi:Na+/H+-dicarboxylate symporter